MLPMSSASSNMTIQNIHNIHLPDMSRLFTAHKLSTPPGMRHPPLTAKQYISIQNIICSVLFYAREVYPTVLMPLNDIVMEQAKAKEKTQPTTYQILDYMATHLDTTIRYDASDMILHIHSDVSYLSVSNACSSLD
jgi:hypothetical protein